MLFYLFLLFVNVYAKVYFKEEFIDDSWEQIWSNSEHSSKEWGKFVLSPGKYYGDLNISKGIQTSEDAKFYGLLTKFEPFSNEGKVLVIQFSVKHEQDIQCGGGYLKIFDCSLKPKNFHAYTPYLIMFGPDICGPDKKVQIIFNYKERKLAIKKKIKCMEDRFTHLYTLIVNPDNTYVVKIDNKIERKGSLEEDWDFLPPRKIEDPKATKLSNFDDNPEIEEPAEKPDDWNQQEHSAVLDAARIDHLDESDDDLKHRSSVHEQNSKSLDESNNNKANLDRPSIDNPDYVADPFLYKYDEICGVGFDIWQVESGTIFDNILIGDDELEAERHGNKTWGAIKEKEKEMKRKIGRLAFAHAERKTVKHDEF